MESRFGLFSLPWKVPTTIILSFFAAIILALGHHLFYQSLDGKLVHKALFNQQYNVAIGTAFAFLVRALLVLSIGTTYWQVFWRTLRSKTLTVSNIDTLFGLLHNGFAFVKVQSLYRHPLLVSIALLSWTVPIAIIVPPATLSIRSEIVTSLESKHVQIPFFNTKMMAQIRGSRGDKLNVPQINNGTVSSHRGCDYDREFKIYNGPSERLSRMTMATAYQGTLPTIQNYAINTSYTLSFTAPATRCEAAPKSVLSELGAFDISTAEGVPNHYYKPEYISWAPTRSNLVPASLQHVAQMYLNPIKFNAISGSSNNGSYGFSSYLGQYQKQPPSLFIAYASMNKSESYLTWHALNCSFFNATYTAHFDFPNGQQKINISSVQLLDDPLKLSVPIWNNCKKGDQTGTILTNEQVGYQAMIDSLGRALVGTMSFSVNGKTDPIVVDQTSVMKTNLAYTAELARLYAISEEVGDPSNENLGTLEYETNITSVPRTGLSLATSIEELFQNMTMSLFSDSSMLIQSPSSTDTTSTSAQNVYSYSWRQLLLAYGVAMLVALLTVIVGCYILLANGTAYSSDFSTFMRLTRGQHIDDVVSAYDDRDGADPLPKALAKAKIHIDGNASQAQTVSKARQRLKEGTIDGRSERTGMLSDASSSISRL